MNSLSNIIENIDDIPERKRKEFTERMRGVPFLEVMNSMIGPYVDQEILDAHIDELVSLKKLSDIEAMTRECMSLKAKKIADLAWEYFYENTN